MPPHVDALHAGVLSLKAASAHASAEGRAGEVFMVRRALHGASNVMDGAKEIQHDGRTLKGLGDINIPDEPSHAEDWVTAIEGLRLAREASHQASTAAQLIGRAAQPAKADVRNMQKMSNHSPPPPLPREVQAKGPGWRMPTGQVNVHIHLTNQKLLLPISHCSRCWLKK